MIIWFNGLKPFLQAKVSALEIETKNKNVGAEEREGDIKLEEAGKQVLSL